jgi:rRNA-processing protein FCF1
MDSLAHIVSKMRRYVVATSDISFKGICQIAAQERKSQTMATELVAGTS